MTAEADFHTRRRMFVAFAEPAANRADLMFAPEGLAASHSEWLDRTGPRTPEGELALGDVWFRGFALDGQLYCYGGGFDAFDPLTCIECRLLGLCAAPLKGTLGLPATAPVHSGMRPGRPGELWEPKLTLGTLGAYAALARSRAAHGGG